MTDDYFFFEREADGITVSFCPADAILVLVWPRDLNAGIESTETTNYLDGTPCERHEIFIEDDKLPEAGEALAKMLIELGDWLREREAKALAKAG